MSVYSIPELRDAIAAQEACRLCTLAACDDDAHAWATNLAEQIADVWIGAQYSTAHSLATYLPKGRQEDLRNALITAASHGIAAMRNVRAQEKETRA